MCGVHWQQHEETDARSRQEGERREWSSPGTAADLLPPLRNAFIFSLFLLVAVRGGSVPRVPGLHGGEHAAVPHEAGEAQDLEEWKE